MGFDDDELLYGNTPDANEDDARDDEPEIDKNDTKSKIIELDKNMFEKCRVVQIGTIRKEFVDFLNSHGMNGMLSTEVPITFWEDRIAHTERHRDDFFSDAIYDLCFKEIPLIIHKPDYISIHPKRNDSISFIKDYSLSHINVAIRVTFQNVGYRTMYPILDATLTHYMDKNNAWKVEYDDKGNPIINENS